MVTCPFPKLEVHIFSNGIDKYQGFIKVFHQIRDMTVPKLLSQFSSSLGLDPFDSLQLAQVLTLSKTTNFDSSKLKEFAAKDLKFEKKKIAFFSQNQ